MLALIIWTALIGVVCYLIVTFLPMPEPFPKLIVVLGVLIVLLIWLQAFGILGQLDRPVPQIR